MNHPDFRETYETVAGGFATARHLTGVPGTIAGCLYDAGGKKVSLSERFGGYKGDLIRTDNPDRLGRPGDLTQIHGRGVYLGHYMGGHYGHFITETLSTFWIFEIIPSKEFDYFLFHPFVFGRDIPEYADFFFEQFGIDASKIVFVADVPVGFDEIVVPERLFRLNHSAHPRLRWVYEQILRGAKRQERPSRLYLSRRRITRTSFARLVANEVRIERLFQRRGFEIVYPELLSFEEQLSLYATADVIAGISGSALHNCLFMRQGTRSIELGDTRYDGESSPTQVLCNAISGVTNTLIPFRGRAFGIRKTLLFRTSVIDEALDGLQLTPVDPDGSTRAGRTWSLVMDVFEIVYLLLRPSFGHLVRLTIGAKRKG